jgi:hypothetical protein
MKNKHVFSCVFFCDSCRKLPEANSEWHVTWQPPACWETAQQNDKALFHHQVESNSRSSEFCNLIPLFPLVCLRGRWC